MFILFACRRYFEEASQIAIVIKELSPCRRRPCCGFPRCRSRRGRSRRCRGGGWRPSWPRWSRWPTAWSPASAATTSPCCTRKPDEKFAHVNLHSADKFSDMWYAHHFKHAINRIRRTIEKKGRMEQINVYRSPVWESVLKEWLSGGHRSRTNPWVCCKPPNRSYFITIY